MLSLKRTNIYKGIALILLLCHHLFACPSGSYQDLSIDGLGMIRFFGVFAKLCVAIFVFLSGYGLTIQCEKKGGVGNVLKFYWRRFLKLMMNYWFIYLVFVPFGVVVFGRTFVSVYGENWILPSILDFFGLFFAITVNYFGYNATWWFYGCIIVLYLLFPLLYQFRKHSWLLVPFALLYYRFGYLLPLFQAGTQYIFSFTLGIILATNSEHIKERCPNWICLILTIILCSVRNFMPGWQLIDGLICFFGILSLAQMKIPTLISRCLVFLGKHSFNIFLFHTFIYSIYFSKYIYWNPNPFIIFFTLLSVCLIISIVLEWLKTRIGFYILQSYLLKKS